MRKTSLLTLLLMATASVTAGETELASVATRFADSDASETPDFQRHVVPLLGKLGCNGRACHGSFQGRGGFRLSLFGYDFKADHEELYGRTDPETPVESLMLQKPLMEIPHEGGQRLKPGSWQYHMLLNWVKEDSPARSEEAAKLVQLDVTPREILFSKAGEDVQLKAVAVWSDGTREDVTDLCRVQTNDDMIAEVGRNGDVASVTP